MGIDGKVRTDPKFPAGFMDVVQIDKTGENFRLIFDIKGRYIIHRITNQEAKYKLCRVREVKTGPKNVPYLYTSDGRTISYPDPIVKANDSIRLDIASNKIMDSIKFEAVTPDVLVLLCIGRDILVHSTSFTSRMLKATPSPLVWVTSLSLARATSPTSACLRAMVSS